MTVPSSSSSSASSSLLQRLVPLALLGLLAVPVGCTHTVNIKSEPAGAEIFVNGQSVGKAPVAYTETSSGGGTVEVKAKLNGQEATQQVPKDQVNWGAVGAGAGGGAGACLALNLVGCVGSGIVGPLAWGANCLGFAALIGGPVAAYFAAGQQMKEEVTITMPAGGKAAATAPPAATAPDTPAAPTAPAAKPAPAATPAAPPPPPPPPSDLAY